MAAALLLAFVLACLSAGCTTVGAHTGELTEVDYGPPATLRVCLLVTDGVPPERATELIAAVNKEFEPYGINVVVPWSHPWRRPGFQMQTIMEEITLHELEPPCDRIMGLVNRNAGDFFWGLALPEVLGAVDSNTHTHGYVVAGYGSVNQVIEPPSAATIHEFYHLLGCPHGASLTNCYHEIAVIKAQSRVADDLFPGQDSAGKYLLSRQAVNAILKSEHGTLVRLCTDEHGAITRAPRIVRSSGNAELDAASLKLASKGPYTPRTKDGRPIPDCFSFTVPLERKEQAADRVDSTIAIEPPHTEPR